MQDQGQTQMLISILIFRVILFVICAQYIEGQCTHSGRDRECRSPNRTQLNIPEPMSLSAFDQHLGGYKSQFLFGTSSIQKTIAENVEVKIEKINSTDYKHSKKAHAEKSGDCIRFTHDLRLMQDVTKAKFKRLGVEPTTNKSEDLVVFWSSCPDQYMWTMFCFDWLPGKVTCPKDNVWVFLVMAKLGRPTNVNLLMAFRDISDDVGIEFGDDNLLWKIDHGKHTACNPRGKS